MNDDQRIDRLRDKLKSARQQTGVDMTILLRKYFIDGFLTLLSDSKYQNRFIWKGGMVLSAITGVHERTTVDVDTLIRGLDLNPSNLTKVINEIISGRKYEGVSYQLKDVHEIQDSKDYAGQRIRINATLGKIQDTFHLDVATGERLIPEEIEYAYRPLLSKNMIPILIYRPERILAEKLQTLLVRTVFNTRMKDYYDIFILSKDELIDFRIFKIAWNEVISERHSSSEWDHWQEIMTDIHDNVTIKKYWQQYTNTNQFAKDISFDEVISICTEWFTLLGD